MGCNSLSSERFKLKNIYRKKFCEKENLFNDPFQLVSQLIIIIITRAINEIRKIQKKSQKEEELAKNCRHRGIRRRNNRN